MRLLGFQFGRAPRARLYAPIPPRKQRELTAAATAGEPKQVANIRKLHQPWQERAFGYYDKMGECWYPAQFVAQALAKARLFAAVTGPNGEPKEIDTKNHWAVELVKAWKGIPEPYGLLRALIGEGRLTYSLHPEPKEGEQPVWEFLSPVELTTEDEGKTIVRRTGDDEIRYTNVTDQPGDVVAGQMRWWRFYRAHPRQSALADSAFKGALDYYEQLYWLTLSERADLRNRVASLGLLLIPEEIEYDADDEEEAARQAEDPDIDPFQWKINQMLTTTLSDPGSAAAASPGVIRAKGEHLLPDRFRLLRFHDPSSSLYISGREDALLNRISISLDLPKEIIMGIGGLNHWNAWKLDDEKFQHVKPEGDALVEDLTEAVLRPIGRAMNKSDVEDVFVALDWAELLSDPDKGKTAQALRAQGDISAEANRKANDFTEDDAPTDAEHLEKLAVDLRDPSLLGFPDPAPAPADGQPPEPADPGADPAADEQPPAEQASANGHPVGYVERVYAAAAVEGRAAAGRWLRGKRRTCPDCIEPYSDVPAEELVAVLGPDAVAMLDETEASLSARMRDRFFQISHALGVELSAAKAWDVENWFAVNLYNTTFPAPDELTKVLGP